MEDMGPGTATAPPRRPCQATTSPTRRTVTLATWKQMLDNGSMQDGDEQPAGHRPDAVARSAATVYDASAERHRHR
jgi:NADH-quinone oxidoreductase subunit G